MKDRFKRIDIPEGMFLEPIEGTGEWYEARRDSMDPYEAEEIVKGGKRELLAALPLSVVEDCYNLLLHGRPLMLTRSAHEGIFEIIWPEKKVIEIEERETFCLRDNDRLYFSKWYEDPDYREEIIVRDYHTGRLLERTPGELVVMPDGSVWKL